MKLFENRCYFWKKKKKSDTYPLINLRFFFFFFFNIFKKSDILTLNYMKLFYPLKKKYYDNILIQCLNIE